jgi:phosphohistidine phosphatase SixA
VRLRVHDSGRLIDRVRALAVAGLLCLAGLAAAAEPGLPGLDAVLEELRKGGLVIYFRHAATERDGFAYTASDAEQRCRRNLSAAGRAEAAQIGRAIKALGIPVGEVLASPFCRTRDTAQLAFGRHAVDEDLAFVLAADAGATRRMTETLRRALSSAPAQGTNTVLVSHTANLYEAAGIFPKPEGVALVFRPLPGGRFAAAARVLPEEWARVAGLAGAPATGGAERR